MTFHHAHFVGAFFLHSHRSCLPSVLCGITVLLFPLPFKYCFASPLPHVYLVLLPLFATRTTLLPLASVCLPLAPPSFFSTSLQASTMPRFSRTSSLTVSTWLIPLLIWAWCPLALAPHPFVVGPYALLLRTTSFILPTDPPSLRLSFSFIPFSDCTLSGRLSAPPCTSL